MYIQIKFYNNYKIYSFKSNNVNIYNAKDTRKFQTNFDLFVVTVLTIQASNDQQ